MPDQERPLVIVSKSEPEDACARLQSYGLNAIPGEAGTDYVWFPHTLRFGIERKTVTNLLGSLKDRQLVEQAQRGIREFDRYFLLIEGEMRRDARGQLQFYAPRHPEADGMGWVTSGWRWDSVDGMLLDFSMLGVIVTHAPSFGYDRKIAAIVGNTCAESHKFIRERQRPTLPAENILRGDLYNDAVWALCALPGIGPEVAEAIIAEYGTLANAIDQMAGGECAGLGCEFEDLKVNGKTLGKKRAKKIRDVLWHDFRPSAVLS